METLLAILKIIGVIVFVTIVTILTLAAMFDKATARDNQQNNLYDDDL